MLTFLIEYEGGQTYAARYWISEEGTLYSSETQRDVKTVEVCHFENP
jgi:hypothetical protein